MHQFCREAAGEGSLVVHREGTGIAEEVQKSL